MCITETGGPSRHRQSGLSLVELVVAIIIVSVGLVALLIPIVTATRHSGDPLVYKQMVALAEGLLEEIELKPFNTGSFGGPFTCANRPQFDRILPDYNGFTTGGAGMCGADGLPIGLLARYNATVAVIQPPPPPFPALAPGAAALIQVTITGPNGLTVTLSAIRTSYF
jgi:MSHA pilin protein MshD